MNLVDIVLKHAKTHGLRNFPWRNIHTSFPYRVLVSEMMLQQTQTSRVVPKFQEFISIFPSISSLANASTREVLKQWSGLGYNRRGVFLHTTAKEIVNVYNKRVPDTEEKLKTLPGIGAYTASAICAFAYNKPSIVIETNIRTAVIEYYFQKTNTPVFDEMITPILKTSLKDIRVRKMGTRYWYSALMDCGAYLKQTSTSHNNRVKGYTIQSTFKDSFRSVRSALVKTLLDAENSLTLDQLQKNIKDARVSDALDTLVRDKLATLKKGRYRIE